MSNENHSNSGNWKSKLEELDSLPGEIMPDKNVAWGKLHERLRGKKRSNNLVWYWAAAACLLIALLIPVIIANKKEVSLAKTETKQNQQSVMSTDLVTKIEKREPVITEELVKGKNEVMDVHQKVDKINHKIIPAEAGNQIRLYDTVNPHDLVTEIAGNALQPIDTSSNIIAVTPAIKKLKVVHINELGDPVEVSPDVASKRDIHSFQLKLATQEVYINPSIAFNKNGFTILKTKSSPN